MGQHSLNCEGPEQSHAMRGCWVGPSGWWGLGAHQRELHFRKVSASASLRSPLVTPGRKSLLGALLSLTFFYYSFMAFSQQTEESPNFFQEVRVPS